MDKKDLEDKGFQKLEPEPKPKKELTDKEICETVLNGTDEAKYKILKELNHK